jgi:DNA-binding MarR family transcriptional regulator
LSEEKRPFHAPSRSGFWNVAMKNSSIKHSAAESASRGGARGSHLRGASVKTGAASKAPLPRSSARQRRSSSSVSDANTGVDDAWRRLNVGRLLNNAIKRFESSILQQMSAAGHGGFSLSHITITRNLDVNGTRATEIARRAGVTKQSMGELITQLEKAGIIERRPDPGDKRAKIVCFTPTGMNWLNAFRAALQEAERQMEKELGSADLRLLKRALDKYGSLDQPESPP